MRIGVDTLRGYILEEVLAFLIRDAGYRLLVDEIQDPKHLKNRGNGLGVRGRGALHQADVLGELEWIPAFTFPLRLFVEAKFRDKKVGIGGVRNAIGVLLDVNQYDYTDGERSGYYDKFQYEYALFSTSGFSKYATRMALAHQISLIDLGGSEYAGLRKAISKTAIILSESTFLDQRRTILLSLRFALRKRLGTLPPGIEASEDYDSSIEDLLEDTIRSARQFGELFVGMANGPFMLLLKAEDRDAFLRYSKDNPRHDVIITWERIEGQEASWNIIPSEERNAYRLTFRVPRQLAKWIFAPSADIQKRAYIVKQRYFPQITIYRFIDRQDYIFRLEFDLQRTREYLRNLG